MSDTGGGNRKSGYVNSGAETEAEMVSVSSMKRTRRRRYVVREKRVLSNFCAIGNLNFKIHRMSQHLSCVLFTLLKVTFTFPWRIT